MYLTGNSVYLKTTTPQESFSHPYICKPIGDDFIAKLRRKPANRVRPDCSVMVAVMLWNPQIVCEKEKGKRSRET